ncbi:hypothetical protein BTR14_13170 [Rhizobium rhizosphaerae]|uniref:Uncharacterized protein n=1 Tax=Xaviernesmea rhizosphaerae TaxID=1672749 RepID=A0ABX3PDB0_9HYPH|nr:hypothetical protein [Xaviernesmea rhizosphaerae]OQP86028.1 hypothetical protein BTR14_13170 [Xaviernesmea rhizosphaerae]
MTPKQVNSEWFVVSGSQQLAGPFKSNGEAWRWIDRQEGELVSKAEERSEWLTKKILGGA